MGSVRKQAGPKQEQASKQKSSMVSILPCCPNFPQCCTVAWKGKSIECFYSHKLLFRIVFLHCRRKGNSTHSKCLLPGESSRQLLSCNCFCDSFLFLILECFHITVEQSHKNFTLVAINIRKKKLQKFFFCKKEHFF